MGMTIDTAIKVLEMVEAHGVCIEAKDIAVDTMRKYQKIERIFKDWCEVGDDGDTCAFRVLKQVICPCIGDKDGND